jgi:hypothetical protein
MARGNAAELFEAWISTTGGSNETVCGDVVPSMQGGQGSEPC